ncbi:BOS complex subunit NOMO3 [Plodia interpunctella]|uniref:BOS complex subunit NOMO3 n=1 Tax=Plodia interpunctella TaxID=58824 RepID=UPI0023684AE6|nr:nodal modulator 3 [Plodia interpunctella]
MRKMDVRFAYDKLILFVFFLYSTTLCNANDILGCGGFVKSHVSLDFSKIEIGLYTKSGSLIEKTECAPNNGYYFLPLYEKGEYILKVHPPAGWSFEPSEVELTIDGVTDKCSTSQDINFSFNGFGIAGKVITVGQQKGPAGIAVQLVDNKGEVRNTVTSVGGDFHFTPVIPGKYTVKASHPRWKLDPAQAMVQVKEGNTALPVGVLAVKGYDVKGSVTAFGSAIHGVYVLLYSKEASPKYRVEGCYTAMLQGLPDSKDSPICHTITDANGEFTFGLVPAGEYKLMVLPSPPGQVTYIVKPEKVDFTVLHDSLYIKNAFEVTGFTLVSSARSAVGADVSGAQLLLDGRALTKTDKDGKFTLTNLQPGTYALRFQHETSVFNTQLSVTQNGNIRVIGTADKRWRVCGSVTPVGRKVLITDVKDSKVVPITPGDDGKWCTFLPVGPYVARVDVSEQEQRDGLQFYPLSHKLSVEDSAIDGISFSQLKGELSGRVVCSSALCDDVAVTLRPLSADGGYIGKPLTMKAKDGKYKFSDVLPGSVEVSVGVGRLCWKESTHNVVLTSQHATVPDFIHTGYILNFHSSHDIKVSYKTGKSSGVLDIPRGTSQQCVQEAGKYELTPLGCHRYQTDTVTADTTAPEPQPIHFQAIAHAVVVRVTSPEAVKDLKLRITTDSKGSSDVGPLEPKPMSMGGYVYEHTLYMADGEVGTVHASSSTLLTESQTPQQLVGGPACQPDAATVRAVRALTLRGRLLPPVPGVTLTLTQDDLKLVQTTTADGTYRFGPLDASKKYEIVAEKESYVFSAPDENGDIKAHKLAEISVELLDEADNSPLQGAPVSVSGGSYRRVRAADADGWARFAGLQPADYYVKPHAKEYRFAPQHQLLHVADGQHQRVTLKGRRVAWSALGRVLRLSGAGVDAAALALAPAAAAAAHCAPDHCTTGAAGAFRIRGLLPGCVYTIELKESPNPDLAGLKIVKAPASLEVKDNKDIEDILIIVIQPQQLTDVNVLVHTANIDHYKTLRLTLSTEDNPTTPIYSTKLDPAGYNQFLNPGLMYALPRLPADNKTYVLQLESSLSKVTHVYNEELHYFVSDGKFKSFDIEFTPKMKSSEQELRQSSLLVVPLLLGAVFACRRRLPLPALAAALGAARAASRPPRHALLDRASIDHIVSTVNAAGKKIAKKKQ